MYRASKEAVEVFVTTLTSFQRAHRFAQIIESAGAVALFADADLTTKNHLTVSRHHRDALIQQSDLVVYDGSIGSFVLATDYKRAIEFEKPTIIADLAPDDHASEIVRTIQHIQISTLG